MHNTIQENVSLSNMTTMRVGGPARFFSCVNSIDALKNAVSFANDRKLNIFILGGGSNILIGDKGFEGIVIKIELKGILFKEINKGIFSVIVGAGETWDDFVEKTINKKLYGLENLSLIPGTVGAAPVQNIGAYGVEVKEVIDWIEVLDIQTMKIKKIPKDKCKFGYRSSIFKTEKGKHFIILRVAFFLIKKGILKTNYKDIEKCLLSHNISKPTLHDIRNIIIVIRKSKFPEQKQIGNAGSFFKNPIISREQLIIIQNTYPQIPFYSQDKNKFKISLAWVIDNVCKLKGVRRGAIGTHKNQPLVLVNHGGGNANDVVKFAEKIKKSVKEKINVEIISEVLFVGIF